MKSTTFLSAILSLLPAIGFADWFEEIKQTATDKQLHQLLYEMPKGGDLHHHLTGSIFSEDWYELARASADHGYRYYT